MNLLTDLTLLQSARLVRQETSSSAAESTSIIERRSTRSEKTGREMVKLSSTRRLLVLANVFNLLVAIYFIIIAIVGLAQLRWYHQLTVAVKARYFITLATSYFAFFILILVGLVLIGLFVGSSLELVKPASHQEEFIVPPGIEGEEEQRNSGRQVAGKSTAPTSPEPSRIVLRRASVSDESRASVCCYIFLHMLVSVGLILILIIWLYNTGELVRDSISGQIDYALARYQFSNRTSHLTIAVDGIQEINTCCGSLDYTDFPHLRGNGLSPSHYPGSCCGKHVFAAQARVICMADEVVRSRRTNGCTLVLASYYDLISLLIVPVALVCLFINITIIALITISRNGDIGLSLGQRQETTPMTATATEGRNNSAPGRERRRAHKLQQQ